MAVERNAITCDGYHAEPAVIVVPDVAPQFVPPTLVRNYAPNMAGSEWPVATSAQCLETLSMVQVH
jgi:hypothetical protein